MSTTLHRGYDLLPANSAQPEVFVNAAITAIDVDMAVALAGSHSSDASDSHASDVDHSVPPGGANGQVLTKASSADFDTAWSTVSGGGGGGSLEVTDGTTSVNGVTVLTLSGATVTTTGTGAATVSIESGGGGGGGGLTARFGVGGPSALHTRGDLYFDATRTPFIQYVQAAGAAGTSPSVDGYTTGTFSSTASGTCTLTTSSASKAVIVAVGNELAASLQTVSSIASASGLVFTKYASKSSALNGTNSNLEVWSAPLAAALVNEIITVTLTGAIDDAALIAFGAEAIDGSAPFVTSGNFPVSAETPASGTPPTLGPFTMATASDALLYIVNCGASTYGSMPSGFTLVTNANNGGASKYDFLALARYAPGTLLTDANVLSGMPVANPSEMMVIALAASVPPDRWVKTGGPQALTWANRPSAPAAGERVFFIDAVVNTFATAITGGGGSYGVPGYYDGTGWFVG